MGRAGRIQRRGGIPLFLRSRAEGGHRIPRLLTGLCLALCLATAAPPAGASWVHHGRRVGSLFGHSSAHSADQLPTAPLDAASSQVTSRGHTQVTNIAPLMEQREHFLGGGAEAEASRNASLLPWRAGYEGSESDPDAPPKRKGGKKGKPGSGRQAGGLIQWPGLGGGQAGPLEYQGGAQMVDPIKVYFILYGQWGQDFGLEVLQNFVASLADSSADAQGPTLHKWWNIATTYTQKDGRGISPEVQWGDYVMVDAGTKKLLGDGFGSTKNDIGPIVKEQISSGKLPLDTSAVYLLLTSSEVFVGDNLNGFCGYSGYCGWHNTVEVRKGKKVQYGFIGDPTKQCNAQCGHNAMLSDSANGKYSIDSMMSTIAHELVEAASDPVSGEGYTALDADGQSQWESADLCNAQYTEPSFPTLQYGGGSRKPYAYNLLGTQGFKYLLQTLPDLKLQQCVLQGEAKRGAVSKGGAAGGGGGGGAKDRGPKKAPNRRQRRVVKRRRGRKHQGKGKGKGKGGRQGNTAPALAPPAASGPPKGEGSDAECAGGRTGKCKGCSGPDGCLCSDGLCLDYCLVTGMYSTCYTCGTANCYCDAGYTCSQL